MFHALNAVELVLATLITTAIVVAMSKGTDLIESIATGAAALAIVALLIQVFVLRPVLDERPTARLHGETLQASHHHVAYIGLEAAKMIALATLGLSIAVASRSATVS